MQTATAELDAELILYVVVVVLPLALRHIVMSTLTLLSTATLEVA